MSICESCGMPMEKESDFGGESKDNKYCVHCTNEAGNLLPKETVRKNMINFFMKMKNTDQETAERFVDDHMSKMPAWK
ncbi:zinc ribbon domain-containing protein [Candidatus Micrarchaeota archaeon]|nr:zinc ribbon domain-containing protein [Candidatus Micrarchaeota archaeon]MBU1681706.1 zinc ribbon domain-containing protein [Candidatus Micrarchaeota archaeon]